MSKLKDYVVFLRNGKNIDIKAEYFSWDHNTKTVKFYSGEDNNDDEEDNLIAIFDIDSVIGVSEVFEKKDNCEGATQLIASNTGIECICYKCTIYPGCFDFNEDVVRCENFSQRYLPKYYPGLEIACKTCIKKDECYAKSKIGTYSPVKCTGYKESE